MIELLLEAETALSLGLLDRAEILYRQVAGADPRNSIAVVGLARVMLERGDEQGALKQARRALAIDAENTAAQRMVERLEEVLAYRAGAETPPVAAAPVSAKPSVAAPAVVPPAITAPSDDRAPTADHGTAWATEPAEATGSPSAPDPLPAPDPVPPPDPEPQPSTLAAPPVVGQRQRSLMDRLLRRR